MQLACGEDDMLSSLLYQSLDARIRLVEHPKSLDELEHLGCE